MAVLPRPRARRGTGAGGVRARVARAGDMAEGVELFDVAVRAGRERVSQRAEAVPHGDPADRGHCGAGAGRGPANQDGRTVALRGGPSGGAGAAAAVSRTGGAVLLS